MQEKLAALLRDEGVPDDRMRFLRYLEMRYISQEYTLSVPVPDGAKLDASEAGQSRRSSMSSTSKLWAHQSAGTSPGGQHPHRGARPERPQGPGPARAAGGPRAISPPDKTRKVVFAGEEMATRFIDRARLQQGEKLSGPLIIVELSCTTVVPPGWEVELDFTGNLLIQKTEVRSDDTRKSIRLRPKSSATRFTPRRKT
jgi:N-methylhydantoinase A